MRHPKRSIRRTVRTRKPRHPQPESRELESTDWPESIRVEERMNPAPVTIATTAKVSEAARLMREARVRHLPVLDGGNRLVGIVTDRDLRQVILDPRLQEQLGAQLADVLESLTVRDIMTWAVITVRPETAIRDAARLLHQRKIGALPVVKNGRLVGILTETDVIRAFAEVLGEGVLARPYRWALRAP
jgi:acetoin utilization protein AcuB